MRTSLLSVIALAALCTAPAALARAPADVEVYDRTSGRVLPQYWHAGECHVAGEPGHEYEIRIRNRTGGRLLAVTSVDGVNVITGQTASPDQGGYVLDPRGRVAIDGWRKSLSEVAAFYFTALPDSYAARTGRPDHVGVIGVALFRERERILLQERELSAPVDAAEAAASPRADAAGRARAEERLGTGHGQRLDSRATRVQFERASQKPEAVVRIYYDSERKLVAQGVIPRPRYVRQAPDPFPGGFVPDP